MASRCAGLQTASMVPLSPLLFILFIDPLSEVIRMNPDISGVKREEKHIISLIADDVLQYLNKPEKSILAVVKSTASFSLSGYKMN